MNVAIIVAAGQGKRFGSEKPKQFLELAGKPVVIHTLERFENCAAIDEIVLVLPSSETAIFFELAAKYDLRKLKSIVAGGETRAESVWRGLQAISYANTEIIAVHDGARPLVTGEEITRTIEKAGETGAAILVSPVTDTIKEINGDLILKTVERSNLRRALTPQCFRAEILRRVFENAANFTVAATDESFLVEKAGVSVSIVEGSSRNIKITVPEDLKIAELFLSQI
ncbi:MAG TPA: 2-C-methyl-D-erythritol 4-phosphate cytidylyltransferase [Pyrinomonadaceae bacterium]|nr:2-C-methyl-D-erythritol 4-phosphate cytidylyltransferase [Pyrinomonadaceae bacterium]